MNDENKRTHFECTDGSGSGWSYPTIQEALQQRDDMRKGFLDNAFMSDENRDYWKKASARYWIKRVTTITKVII